MVFSSLGTWTAIIPGSRLGSSCGGIRFLDRTLRSSEVLIRLVSEELATSESSPPDVSEGGKMLALRTEVHSDKGRDLESHISPWFSPNAS